jgi:hypothetical protein
MIIRRMLESSMNAATMGQVTGNALPSDLTYFKDRGADLVIAADKKQQRQHRNTNDNIETTPTA